MYDDVLDRIKQLDIQSVDEFDMYGHLTQEFDDLDEALNYLASQNLIRFIKTEDGKTIVRLRSPFNV